MEIMFFDRHVVHLISMPNIVLKFNANYFVREDNKFVPISNFLKFIVVMEWSETGDVCEWGVRVNT